MYVPQGSVLTYQFKVATSYTSSPTSIEQSVASDLSAAGFTVLDFSLDSSIVGVIASLGAGYTAQITMKIRTNGIDYGNENDVKSIFDHYVIQETGQTPASVILDVKIPTAVVSTTTGDTQKAPGSAAGGGAAVSSSWDTFTTFIEGLGSGAILAIGLAIIGVVLLAGWAQSRKLI